MEITAQSLSHAKLPSCSFSLSPPLFHSKAYLLASNSVHFQSSTRSFNITQLQAGVKIRARKLRNVNGPVFASAGESPSSTDVAVRWLLEPVGDGDTRHIGFKVELPGAFEISSSEVTVGRLPEAADMVIPVATVSGRHARIQKKGDSLRVIDLDSTNGTFIDDKRVRPGVIATLSPGSSITFGDTHLAMFRVSKLENAEPAASKPEEFEGESETNSLAESIETAS